MNRRFEKHSLVYARTVSAALAVLSTGVLAVSGCAAKQDQGRLMTTAEVQTAQDAGKVRIENDGNLSDKSKAAMLKARAGAMERAASETHPPPPPGR